MTFKTSCLLDSLEAYNFVFIYCDPRQLLLYIAPRYCVAFRAVIKGREPGISPHHYERDFHLLL